MKKLEEAGPADQVLKGRYAAAVDLLEAALEKLPEIGSLRKRVETVESILQSSIDHTIDDRLDRAVREHLEQVDTSLHEQVKPVRENCRTPEQVAETFKNLMALINGSRSYIPRTDPLPQRSPKPVNENTQRQQGGVISFAGRIGNRLSRAV